jgi:tetratricopeptide (TPR) repeat protein
MILGEAAIPVWVILAAFVGWYWIAPALNPGPSGPSGYWGHLGGAAAGFAFALCAGLVTHGAIDYSMEDALTLISKGQLKAGLQVLHALLKARPDDTRVPLALAREYVKVWDRDAGARYYALSIRKELDAGRLDNAIADWDEAVASQVPLTARHALPLANAAQQAGKIETALKLYEWAAPLADETTRAVIAARIEAIRRGVR